MNNDDLAKLSLQVLFDSVDQGIAVSEMVYAEDGEIVDMIYRRTNEPFERIGGVQNVVDRSIFDVLPGVESYWLDRYKHVARTGLPLREQNYQQDVDRWFDCFFARVDEDGRYVVTIFNDITEQKRAEATRFESDKRQAFLLRFSDGLRAEDDVDGIAERAIRSALEHLKLDRCYLTTYALDKGIATVDYQIGNESIPELPDYFDLSHYPEALRLAHGQTVIIEDDFERRGLSDEESRNSKALGMRALLAPTLRKGASSPLWSFGAASSTPRRWSRDEISLVEEIAERTWSAMEAARQKATLREGERRQAFLLKLSDAIRLLAEPVEVQTVALRLLAEHLGLSRAAYWEIQEDQDRAHRVATYDRALPPLPQDMRISDFSADQLGCYLEGRPFVVMDTEANGRVAATREACRAIQVRAWVGVPIVKRGRLLTVLGVEKMTPHRWTDAEIELVQEVAERTWAASERGHVEAALRKSEERFRLAIEGSKIALYECDLDLRYTWITNPAEGWRPSEIVGRTDAELLPPDYARTLMDFKRRALAADAALEEEMEGAPSLSSRWFLMRAEKLLGAGGEVSGLRVLALDIDELKKVESSLRESEERYRTLFDSIDQGFCVIQVVFDGDGRAVDYRFLEVNRAFEGQTGLGAAQGRLMRELRPDHEEFWFETYGRIARTRVPERFEHAAAALNRFYEVYAFPFGAPGDLQVGILFRDVADQRRAAEALTASEQRLRQFGEASQDVLWIRDAERLQWTYLTPAFEAIHGLPREEALEGNNYRSWLDLIVPDDRERATDNIRRVRNGEHVTFDYRIKRPVDGQVRWLRNTDFPITDETGKVVLIGGIGHDLTELRETEVRLATLVQGIPQLVWRAVNGGHWTWASPQWVDYAGLSVVESLGWGWLEALHPDDQSKARSAWDHAVETGGFEVEYRVRHVIEQEYRWFQTRATPVLGEGGAIIEWLGTSTDIHDLRELQKRQEVLVAELQHRTRNLMAVITAVTERTIEASRDLPDFCARFRDRLNALARVQGLLSRLSDTDRVAFDELIRSELAAMNSAGKNVRLNGPSGIRLRSSMVQTLALALHELATNAVKYGALGQPDAHLEVRWRMMPPDRKGRPRLLIEWIESGVRMPAVGSAPQGTGQGRELIEEALPYQLGAQTEFEMGPDGVRCTIDIPVSQSNGEGELT